MAFDETLASRIRSALVRKKGIEEKEGEKRGHRSFPLNTIMTPFPFKDRPIHRSKRRGPPACAHRART
jgi:hypothetical protein